MIRKEGDIKFPLLIIASAGSADDVNEFKKSYGERSELLSYFFRGSTAFLF